MKNLKLLAAAAALSLVAFSQAQTHAQAKDYGCGGASWYALTSITASGERMDPNLMTAAHKTLPFGTKLRVTNPKNGKSAVVRINDRGPFIKGRVIDLSKAAAAKLGFINAGHTKVCMVQVS